MTNVIEIRVPDIGGASDVEIIELNVAIGDRVQLEDPLMTLEGDKATMEVPSPQVGVIKSWLVAVGDTVSENSLVMMMEVAEATGSVVSDDPKPAPASASVSEIEVTKESVVSEKIITKSTMSNTIYASPAVRRLAGDLEIDLSVINGTGDKGRITKDDLHQVIKQQIQQGGKGSGVGGGGIPAMPAIDFAKFGTIEKQDLNKIKRATAQNMQRSWLNVPHVTQFDQADITMLEACRQAHKEKAKAQGIRLTPLVFIMKAVVQALQAFPTFNASLDPGGNQLILKKYYHIGVAVDTPNGLVVPVIKNVDQKNVFELAEELVALSTKARDKGLSMKEMQGGCFTISSLGGIGGTAFTPIVNAPEVAILGLSKSSQQPVWQDGGFVPRLMLPLSLSYDHRVIDGAQAAHFTQFLTTTLQDVVGLMK